MPPMKHESFLMNADLDKAIKKAEKLFNDEANGFKIKRSATIRMLIVKGLQALEINVKKDA